VQMLQDNKVFIPVFPQDDGVSANTAVEVDMAHLQNFLLHKTRSFFDQQEGMVAMVAIPHMLLSFLAISMNPCMPQSVPHEFLTNQ